MSMWQGILAVLTVCTCLFLMLIILIQRGRGSGLAGAFGGAGGSSAFGAKTGDVLTWATVIIAFLFLTLTVVANFQFDESPQAVTAAEPFDIPATTDIPIGEIPAGDAGSVTRITIPPLDVPTEVFPPATTRKDEAAPTAPSTADENTAGGDD